jgi:CBS domain-containing membrane protein
MSCAGICCILDMSNTEVWPMPRIHDWLQWIGLELSPVTHSERLISALGGLLAILAVFLLSRAVLGPAAALPVVASMGASTVLLFALPHGTLAQPWPVFGGHVVSALIGVTCGQFIAEPVLAGALAVGLAIGAMHYLRCIHPPGGATALVAVIGGPAIGALGYGFVLAPVALNALILISVAVVFNAFFVWRRYPAHLHRVMRATAHPEIPAIRHEDFVYALSQLDTYVDVSEEDLLRIYALATGRQSSTAVVQPGLPSASWPP